MTAQGRSWRPVQVAGAPNQPGWREDPAAWFLGPDDLAAIHADDQLLEHLVEHGAPPDPQDQLGQLLAAWLAEVDDQA